MTTNTGLRDQAEIFLALADNATPGAWVATECMDVWVEADGIGVAHCGDIDWVSSDGVVNTEEQMKANGAFVAAAKTDAPDIIRALLASLAEARELAEDVRAIRGAADFLDKAISITQPAFDQGPEPTTAWDHEACSVVIALREIADRLASPASAKTAEDRDG